MHVQQLLQIRLCGVAVLLCVNTAATCVGPMANGGCENDVWVEAHFDVFEGACVAAQGNKVGVSYRGTSERPIAPGSAFWINFRNDTLTALRSVAAQ